MLTSVSIYNDDGGLVTVLTLAPHSKVVLESTNSSSIEIKNDNDCLGLIVDTFDCCGEYYNSITYLYEDLEEGV